jgi:uncharacterized protein
MESAKYWIEKLELTGHPEGGYFKENYRAKEQIAPQALPERFKSARDFSTAIYFLLEGNDFSAFHRIKQDELWHFYQGGPLLVHVIAPNGEYSQLKVGSNFEQGEQFQAVVKAGSWFASELADKSSFALVGCTVAPGFDFEDFELAEAQKLAKEFPRHEPLIRRLCR